MVPSIVFEIVISKAEQAHRQQHVRRDGELDAGEGRATDKSRFHVDRLDYLLRNQEFQTQIRAV